MAVDYQTMFDCILVYLQRRPKCCALCCALRCMCALGAILECCCMDRFVCCVFRSPTDYSMKFQTHCIAVGNLTCGRAHKNKAVHTITHQSEKSERAVNDCQDRKGAGLWWCQSFVTDAGCKIPHSQVYCYEKSNDQIQ